MAAFGRVRSQTDGMVERFSGRIELVLQSHRFGSGDNLEQTLLLYVLHNMKMALSTLRSERLCRRCRLALLPSRFSSLYRPAIVWQAKVSLDSFSSSQEGF
jgi:hypothetical protein